ncbi:hypothetical protein HK102_006284 [Quaeritorhiza haematococci]|nr:hypothetical protein HK102_006284 [Quaeritorhiza haematococci]
MEIVFINHRPVMEPTKEDIYRALYHAERLDPGRKDGIKNQVSTEEPVDNEESQDDKKQRRRGEKKVGSGDVVKREGLLALLHQYGEPFDAEELNMAFETLGVATQSIPTPRKSTTNLLRKSTVSTPGGRRTPSSKSGSPSRGQSRGRVQSGSAGNAGSGVGEEGVSMGDPLASVPERIVVGEFVKDVLGF